jgi:hypothetical protein
MGIKFNESKGSAIKGPESFKYADDENVVRLVGDILPRYVYWLKGTNNKDIPAECLSFNREKEKFDNKEKDHVPDFFPGIKCQWAYVMNCIDPKDGKVKVINLKKKLLQQIMDAASDGLGDPTDPVTGWDVVFKRKKTGPLTFNVEYSLSVLKLKKRALSPEELDAVEQAETIDKKVPRPTPEQIKDLCAKITSGESEESSDSDGAGEAAKDL